MMKDTIWKALLAEFIGTFTLIFVGVGGVIYAVQQTGLLGVIFAAFAFGLIYLSMIYAFGTISGAHLNPAVSLGFASAGRMGWGAMVAYWIVQTLAALLALAMIVYIFGTAQPGQSTGSFITANNWWGAIILEAVLTFLLVLVFLFVSGNSALLGAGGFAIGAFLAAAMFIAYPLTGGSFNPARSLTNLFYENPQNYWIYLIGPLIGGILAGLIYRLFMRDGNCQPKVSDCGEVMRDHCGNVVTECCQPKIDPCGKPVVDCQGRPEVERFLRRKVNRNHLFQTTKDDTAAFVQRETGFAPEFLKQKIEKMASKVSKKTLQ